MHSLVDRGRKTNAAPGTKKETRATRGVALYSAVREAIEHIEGSRYLVPSARTDERYAVDLERGTCTCVDAPRARRQGQSCKHQVAAELRHAELRRELLNGRAEYIRLGLESVHRLLRRHGVTVEEEAAAYAALEKEAAKPADARELEGYVALRAALDVRHRPRGQRAA